MWAGRWRKASGDPYFSQTGAQAECGGHLAHRVLIEIIEMHQYQYIPSSHVVRSQMCVPARVPASLSGIVLPLKLNGAFTLVEIVVALLLIGITAGAALWAMTSSNRQAGASRLFTTAQAIAQNHIELVQTDGPFNPQALPQPQIPDCLAIGSFAKPNAVDPSPVVIYTDPVNANVIVTGSLNIDVSDPGFVLSGQNLNVRQVTVKLAYNYGGHSYQVKMSTLRASDL